MTEPMINAASDSTLDLEMATTNGRETYAMLSEFAPNLPVLIVSGWPEEHAPIPEPGVRRAGSLHKPFGPDELIAAFRTVMSDARAPHAG